jgi:transcriptional regulator with XRE-family HTH domain
MKPRRRLQHSAGVSRGTQQPTKSPEIDIGTRLRHARLMRAVSLRELAEEVGCTEGFLSKIENNKARPSLAMLHRVVARLGINVATLFAEDRSDLGPVSIMRNGQRATITTHSMRRGRGIVLERLVSNALANLLEANIHHVAPKGSSDGAIEHKGEEIGFVLQGKLKLVVDNQTYLVEEGDAFFFRSSLPHSYSNPGAIEAKVLWVNTPPSF